MNDDSFYREFGKLLRQLRRRKKFTQSGLAERVGLSRTSVTNIEVGRQKIPLHLLYVLSSSLGVEPEELLPKKESLSDQSLLNETAFKSSKEGSELNEEGRGWVSRVLKPRSTKKTGGNNELAKSGKGGAEDY